MKPAPPEEMLRRQMDKLEEAILSVDAEHAEALPAEALAGEEEVFADAVAPIAEQVEPPPAEADEPEAYRSEEHTSELQSLMRISYAVFCLKKKIKPNRQQEAENKEESRQLTKVVIT